MMPTDQSIFGNQIGQHIPLSTVTDRISEKPLHQTSTKILISSFDGLFQKPVGLFQLIEEE